MTDRQLPDFDVMIALANEIGNLKKVILLNKGKLDVKTAQITQDVLSNETFWGKDKKQPSMASIEKTFLIIGRNDEETIELATLRAEIARDEGLAKQKDLLFQVYRDMIDVWRTESANKRGAYLDA
jgi:hypothetical protein